MSCTGVALVVGAGSGIGLETAYTFAQRGARSVVFADRDPNALLRAAENSKKLATAKGYQALVIPVDMTVRSDVGDMVAETLMKFGRIDYAVHCAGIPGAPGTTFSQIDYDEFCRTINVNCGSVFNFLQEVINVMKFQDERFAQSRSGWRSLGRGSITVVTNFYALFAALHAVRGLIKVAALENRSSGVRINEICPIASAPDNVWVPVASALPLGRTAVLDEVAGVAYFLATASAGFIHGQSIIVDSGLAPGTIESSVGHGGFSGQDQPLLSEGR